MPTAVSTPLEYPEGAQGEASVALELTLTASGEVTHALAIEGDEPFAGRAVTSAKAWKFEPATRDGQPIAAKIRFLVRFVPPRDVEEPAALEAPSAAGTPEKKSPEAKPYEIVVVGEERRDRHELARTEISRIPGASATLFGHRGAAGRGCRSSAGYRISTFAARHPATSVTSSTAFRCRFSITLRQGRAYFTRPSSTASICIPAPTRCAMGASRARS